VLTPTRDRDRISALTVGLAATIIIWTFAAAYASATLDALGEYSPWLYGPASTLAWAVFSAIAYLVIHRSGQQGSPPQSDQTYHCHELGIPTPLIGDSVCASRDEKNHLGAVTAGFALTITAWVGALSLMPADWLDSLSAAPPWSYCLGSVGLWAALSTMMYSIFSAADRRRHRSKI
jgi:membrane associated rhomboid family serine protease